MWIGCAHDRVGDDKPRTDRRKCGGIAVRRHAGVDANSVDPDRGMSDSIYLHTSDDSRRLTATDRERDAGRRVEYGDVAALPRGSMPVDAARYRPVVRDRRGNDRECRSFVGRSVPENSASCGGADYIANVVQGDDSFAPREIDPGVSGDLFRREIGVGTGVPTSARGRDLRCRPMPRPLTRGPARPRSAACRTSRSEFGSLARA